MVYFGSHVNTCQMCLYFPRMIILYSVCGSNRVLYQKRFAVLFMGCQIMQWSINLGTVSPLGSLSFLFGYGLSFRCGLLIWLWSFYLGTVFFRHATFPEDNPGKRATPLPYYKGATCHSLRNLTRAGAKRESGGSG